MILIVLYFFSSIFLVEWDLSSFYNMGCENVQNDGVKIHGKVQNIEMRTRSRSLKGGSEVGSVEDNIGKTTSRGEKWTKGEVEALLDAYEYNYVESKRPNHGELQ
jgi:hypothetical protein